ncbi:glycerophosphodiester phosphodiesterase family protein [Rhizobium sp. NRK18]|uniref:glycerophosphodiester phosphodiesterase family protein n=1 Tax=Rhizobium sp. NRK18 TaxID=2964667 RepID=UPI0021C27F6E|nr:glycerophosphodiester phosphodiesterase family protein [Rhizobium sp. NRK18]MCQ2006085.1 glycerophosphodiester phosphodiesterase [Rhizobium sp. NRK18]
MTRIASHRGGTLEFGDSTWAGFAATAAMAVEEVEFDLHPTADGRIIVHHDATLDRTTDTAGIIADMTAEEVRRAIVDHSGEGFRHPLFLEELCDIFQGSTVAFRCEIKPGHDGRLYQGFVPKAVAALEAADRLSTTTFSSFLLDTLKDLSAATDRPSLWLVAPAVLKLVGAAGVMDLARLRGIPEIGVHIDTADRTLQAMAEEAGLAFGCWAAHTRPQIGKALDLGVKVFTTDRPTLALDIRNARNDSDTTRR